MGAEQPLGAGTGTSYQEGQAGLDTHRVPLAGPGRQPVPGLGRDPSAGLAGIRGRYELPKEASANIYHMSAQERLAEGIKPLPASLADALDAMETSELVAETLGEHVFEWFLRNKRAEWAAYKAEVTPFELRRYLAAL